jgi:PIN domain nuclease of toxin-antitoxin system
LEEAVRAAILAPENQVFISSASVWEIAIKAAAGRLVVPIHQDDAIARRLGATILPIQPGHAILAGTLPRHHADPFDRMLIAQAVVENLILVSSDSMMGRYGVRTLGPAGP